KYYRLTAAGRYQVWQETSDWVEASSIVARFLESKESL
ncbi:MAG: PadR family transcriptional regulator, partial [Candidatus Angelobacter sp.]|nr:PadR family transcriptional regulator [Candidatus Angelobacter sp.]